jgi:hypothetical protein
MTISATTQGIKPGVCLSTSRPVNPFDGQVIYMTDVDQTAVWDGSQWTVLAPVAGGRNMIINGAMQVAQRGTSTASITTVGYYTADRWNTLNNTLGTWTQSVENDAPTGSGFRKSVKMVCTTADASPAAGDYLLLNQRLEGQNVQQFLKGTPNAKQLTLSFWAKSNITGTYIVELLDATNNRSISALYTINASATWEKETITFPVDTTGQIANDNAIGLELFFWLAGGSNYTSGTLNTSWSTRVISTDAPGQVNLASATSNYWQVTGVQLELGTITTPFEIRNLSDTIRFCQRYYENNPDTQYASALGSGRVNTIPFVVTKREHANVSVYRDLSNLTANTNISQFIAYYGDGALKGTQAINSYINSDYGFSFNFTNTGSKFLDGSITEAQFVWQADAEIY